MAKTASVVRTESAPEPKKTRDTTVVMNRYSVKSYHSTTVENAATTNEARGSASTRACSSGRAPAAAAEGSAGAREVRGEFMFIVRETVAEPWTGRSARGHGAAGPRR